MRYFGPGDEGRPTTVVPVDGDVSAQHYIDNGWREFSLVEKAPLTVTRDENGNLWVDDQKYVHVENGWSSPTIAELRARERNLRERADKAGAVADFLEEEAKAQLAEYAAKVDRLTAIVESAPELTERSIAVHLLEHGVTLP